MKKGKKHNPRGKLTGKQERFCYEYCIDFNATQAAIRAGYNIRMAYTIGHENTKKPEIQNRIKEMQDKLAETAGISALRVLREHEKLAFSSIAHLHNTWIERTDFEKLTNDQKDSIKSISTKILKKNIGTNEEPEIVDVEFVKVELYDKQKSLDSISKMLGFDAPIKTELTGANGKELIPSMQIEVIDRREQVILYDQKDSEL